MPPAASIRRDVSRRFDVYTNGSLYGRVFALPEVNVRGPLSKKNAKEAAVTRVSFLMDWYERAIHKGEDTPFRFIDPLLANVGLVRVNSTLMKTEKGRRKLAALPTPRDVSIVTNYNGKSAHAVLCVRRDDGDYWIIENNRYEKHKGATGHTRNIMEAFELAGIRMHPFNRFGVHYPAARSTLSVEGMHTSASGWCYLWSLSAAYFYERARSLNKNGLEAVKKYLVLGLGNRTPIRAWEEEEERSPGSAKTSPERTRQQEMDRAELSLWACRLFALKAYVAITDEITRSNFPTVVRRLFTLDSVSASDDHLNTRIVREKKAVYVGPQSASSALSPGNIWLLVSCDILYITFYVGIVFPLQHHNRLDRFRQGKTVPPDVDLKERVLRYLGPMVGDEPPVAEKVVMRYEYHDGEVRDGFDVLKPYDAIMKHPRLVEGNLTDCKIRPVKGRSVGTDAVRRYKDEAIIELDGVPYVIGSDLDKTDDDYAVFSMLRKVGPLLKPAKNMYFGKFVEDTDDYELVILAAHRYNEYDEIEDDDAILTKDEIIPMGSSRIKY